MEQLELFNSLHVKDFAKLKSFVEQTLFEKFNEKDARDLLESITPLCDRDDLNEEIFYSWLFNIVIGFPSYSFSVSVWDKGKLKDRKRQLRQVEKKTQNYYKFLGEKLDRVDILSDLSLQIDSSRRYKFLSNPDPRSIDYLLKLTAGLEEIISRINQWNKTYFTLLENLMTRQDAVKHGVLLSAITIWRIAYSSKSSFPKVENSQKADDKFYYFYAHLANCLLIDHPSPQNAYNLDSVYKMLLSESERTRFNDEINVFLNLIISDEIQAEIAYLPDSPFF